jgi:hypothetical protein
MEFLKIKRMQRNRSRRFFLTVVSAAIGGLVFLKRIWLKKTTPEMARFLTHDGKLVDVPLNKLPLKKIAITKDRLVSWIWKQQKL